MSGLYVPSKAIVKTNSNEIGIDNKKIFLIIFLLKKNKNNTKGKKNNMVLNVLFKLKKKLVNKAIKHKTNAPQKKSSKKLLLLATFLSTIL